MGEGGPTDDRTPYRAFRQFNGENRSLGGAKFRLSHRSAELFQSDSMPDKLARALAQRRAIDLKELVESFEFFQRVRRRIRAPSIADLCCGHGLTGILFAIFEVRVERVLLVDRSRPDSHAKVLDAAIEVAPWVREKIQYLEADLRQAVHSIPRETAIVAVHACGGRTDQCIEAAITLGSNLAVMPCCHSRSHYRGPRGLLAPLSVSLATDIERTYALERAGYRVAWSAIPAEVTAHHRILVAIEDGTSQRTSTGL